MFVLATVADTIPIPPSLFSRPTLDAIHDQIDRKYPNRVLMDVGLVICRHGNVLEMGDGVLATGTGGSGDGCAHHEVVFRAVVFRPFVDEVMLGTVLSSDGGGVRVGLGRFFEDVRIPAYWMLRPSRYDAVKNLWVWTPNYDDDDDDDDDDNNNNEGGEAKNANANENDGKEGDKSQDKVVNENCFEMELGSEIRFRVKSINFTRITKSSKGLQATTTTTSVENNAISGGGGDGGGGGGGGVGGGGGGGGGKGGDHPDRPVRKRSTSVDLTDTAHVPAAMHITASICEDGLGLTSWWAAPEEDGGGDEHEQEQQEGEEGEGEGEYYEDDQGEAYDEEFS